MQQLLVKVSKRDKKTGNLKQVEKKLNPEQVRKLERQKAKKVNRWQVVGVQVMDEILFNSHGQYQLNLV